jgi:hypothetical protein
MKTIPLRVDVRIPEDMYQFLLEQAGLKKLSFEGLLLQFVRERMEQQRRELTGQSR